MILHQKEFRHLLPPFEVKRRLPLSGEGRAFVAASRKTAEEILLGRDLRKVVIVGPCSIHDPESALAYAKELKETSLSPLYLVMRVYVEKARTSGGWKGLMYDPGLRGDDDLQQGILMARSLLLKLTELQVPAAMEFVEPLAAPFFDDLITWGFIGARTSSSQVHRQLASSLPMPVGFKNSTDGDLDHPIHGILTARAPHSFLQIDPQGILSSVRSEGNRMTHLVLRGSDTKPNYQSEAIDLALQKLRHHRLPERILVDCSHGNSSKTAEGQINAFTRVLDQMLEGNGSLFGWMLESHLNEGNQPLTPHLKWAVSITDPCLSWPVTFDLLQSAAGVLSSTVMSSTQS